MATKFTPLHDRILVRRIEEGETTRGGIIIPDSAKDKPQEGEVISVGKGKSNEEGKVFPLARERRRPHPVRQVFRHRNQDGWRRFHHHARRRSPRRPDRRAPRKKPSERAQVVVRSCVASRLSLNTDTSNSRTSSQAWPTTKLCS